MNEKIEYYPDGKVKTETTCGCNGKVKDKTEYYLNEKPVYKADYYRNGLCKQTVRKLAILGAVIASIAGAALIARGCASRQDNTLPAQVLNTQHQR